MIAVLLLLAAAVWGIGGKQLLIGERTPIPVPWAALAPCIGAYAIAASAVQEVLWLDALGARPVLRFQLGYLGAISALNAALLWWATAPLDGELGAVAALRNYAGFLGLSLAAAVVLGAEIGWMAPTVVLFAGIFGASNNPKVVTLTWMIQPDETVGAAIVAAGYLALGFAAAGSRRLRLLVAQRS